MRKQVKPEALHFLVPASQKVPYEAQQPLPLIAPPKDQKQI